VKLLKPQEPDSCGEWVQCSRPGVRWMSPRAPSRERPFLILCRKTSSFHFVEIADFPGAKGVR